ncbi:MAG: biotin-dependent carboxyltransferase family protein [Gaiellaceae bacterium]
MIEVLEAGLETAVQDYPGRKGCFGLGFPPSGPIDHWSFRLANLLVGNPPGAAALEMAFTGPTLTFADDAVIALTGADMQATLEGVAVAPWESVAVGRGQTLAMAYATSGGRGYLAVAGGIDAPLFLESRSTCLLAMVCGWEDGPLRPGQLLPVGTERHGEPGRRVPIDARPAFATNKSWTVDCVRGPNDDWIHEDAHQRWFSAGWTLSSSSNRVGFRLHGPEWTFTEKATNKAPENGEHPSNIIDHGYPIGGVNLSGMTPIILMNDGLSLGGFINPYTIPHGEFWKLGQSQPGDVYRFREVSVEEAQNSRRTIDALCVADAVEAG